MKQLPDIETLFAADFHANGSSGDGLPAAVTEKIMQQGLFKCFLPESLGGLALGLSETMEIIERCSYIDGSFGWLVQIGNGGNYFAASFDEPTAKKLFGPAHAVLAGSGTPSGTAVAVPGGWRVSGRWRYCSGADYASFFTAVCRAEGSGETFACALLREQVNVTGDWKASGLKNTSTHSIEVTDAFVPDEHLFVVGNIKWLSENPVFTFPFLGFAQCFFLALMQGLFRRLLDETQLLSGRQAAAWDSSAPGRRKRLDDVCSAARRALGQARDTLYAFTNEMEVAAGENRDRLSEQLKTEAFRQNRLIMDYAHRLFPLLGMTVLFSEHVINRVYMDMICASQHALLNDYEKL